MTRQLFIAASFFFGIVVSNTCFGQLEHLLNEMQQRQNNLASQMEETRRQQQIGLEQMNAQIQETGRQEQQSRLAAIENYRNQTGDWQNSDAAIFQHLQQQYFAQNPGAWEAKQAEDRELAAGYQRINSQRAHDNLVNAQARSAAITDANHYINQLSTDGYNRRMASADSNVHGFINAMTERSDYYDPQTGQTANLSFHHNQIQSAGGLRYYTDNNGTVYRLGVGD